MLFRMLLVCIIYACVTAITPTLLINPLELYQTKSMPTQMQLFTIAGMIVCVEIFVSLTKLGWQMKYWFYTCLSILRITALIGLLGSAAYAFGGESDGIVQRANHMCNATGFYEQCAMATNTLKGIYNSVEGIM